LPRTTTLGPEGSGFAGKVFVPEAGTGHVRFGRRTVRLVGEFEFRDHAPEALEIVIAPGLLAENVYDKAAELE